MALVEIRELEGPNIFLLEPAIKIELKAEPSAQSGTRETSTWLQARDLLATLHKEAGLKAPAIEVVPLESPGHFAVAFGFSNRRAALAIAEVFAARMTGGDA